MICNATLRASGLNFLEVVGAADADQARCFGGDLATEFRFDRRDGFSCAALTVSSCTSHIRVQTSNSSCVRARNALVLGNLHLRLLNKLGGNDVGSGLALDGPGQRRARSVSWIAFPSTVTGGPAAPAIARCQRDRAQIVEDGNLFLDIAEFASEIGQLEACCLRAPA